MLAQLSPTLTFHSCKQGRAFKGEQPGALPPIHRTLSCDGNRLAQPFAKVSPGVAPSCWISGQKQKETQTFVALLKP